MRALPQQVISLIHYVELSNAGWWETTVDRCVLAALWLIKEAAPASKIRKEVERQLDLEIKANELNDSLRRLLERGEIVDTLDGRYKVSVDTEIVVNQRVEEAKLLEAVVKDKFKQKIEPASPSQDSSRLWEKFKNNFLVPLVTDAGAKIYEFFLTKSKDNNWISYADDFLREIPEDCRGAVSQAIFEFLDPDQPEITRFMLSYLDAYFVITASGLSSKAANKLAELRKAPIDFVIFADTNFIFSILALHSNPLNETARDLMNLVKTVASDVNVSFVISPLTIKEAQQSIKYYRIQLGASPYPPNLAQAALDTEISGVFSTFFESVTASGKQISPVDYFAPYEKDLVRILEDKGVNVFTEGDIQKYAGIPKVNIDIGNQIIYEENKYKGRAKSEYKITKDVVLWHFVQDLRNKKLTLPIQAKYWIVTVDYRFLIFDKFKTKPTGLPPVCMTPAQFIQALRFFAPRSPQFEKMMLGSMRFPLMSRQFDSKAERITLRILSQLARFEGVNDLSVETIERVITDDALRGHLTDDHINSDAEELKVVENSLAKQLAEYENSITKKDDEVAQLRTVIQEFSSKSEERDREREKLLSELRDIENRLNIKESDEARAKAKAGYALLLVALIIPHIVLLTIMWQYLLANIMYPVISIAVSLLLTFGVGLAILYIARRQGEKDEYIKSSEFFRRAIDSLRLTTIIFFLLSAVWGAASSLMNEGIRSVFFP